MFFAKELNLTEFKHVSIYGTKQKAYNSQYNVIHKEDAKLLQKIFYGMEINKDILSNLRKPALKLLKRKYLNDDDKLELIYEVLSEFEGSRQETVPLNDINARWMYNKFGYYEIAYNVQSAVDTESKLICGIKVS